ncbi:hypothetical protein ACLIMP_05840 [Novosphingobium aerophilum]|uniref:hypothetical protein n=1 Tax=Novosphingobium TaxID=165696 RepID=UPI0006C8D5FA|nr:MULTISPECIES: hypothetical protein [unclassified Novosphingobium]KPH65840.1 hypothetical protein ADT71_10045 [Novosphingobium sp. ST904]TCM29152.1 hypothetical protein EDF59_12889 [Novosphingobium sp. ST904]WRT93758.1 hypothetical protein U9J33_04385 [Novosphingobium sp. RL4]
MSRALHALKVAWGWTGVDFAEEVAHSLMGHMLLIDREGIFHYLDPDLLSLSRLGDEAAAQAHMALDETKAIWRADALVDAATQRLGFTATGEVYSRTLSAILSGDYGHENLVRIDLVDLIYLTGDLARQTRDLPDGARVQLKAT